MSDKTWQKFWWLYYLWNHHLQIISLSEYIHRKGTSTCESEIKWWKSFLSFHPQKLPHTYTVLIVALHLTHTVTILFVVKTLF